MARRFLCDYGCFGVVVGQGLSQGCFGAGFAVDQAYFFGLAAHAAVSSPFVEGVAVGAFQGQDVGAVTVAVAVAVRALEETAVYEQGILPADNQFMAGTGDVVVATVVDD